LRSPPLGLSWRHASTPEPRSGARPARARAGSLLVILLLRTAHYNLAALRDVYLHTNTLAALANLAPHMHSLSSLAAQRLVSLFDMLARRRGSKSLPLTPNPPTLSPRAPGLALRHAGAPARPWGPRPLTP